MAKMADIIGKSSVDFDEDYQSYLPPQHSSTRHVRILCRSSLERTMFFVAAPAGVAF